MSDYIPMNNGIGSDAVGAFAGALFGSWFGDGWGNYGRGGAIAGEAAGFSTSLLNDGLNNIQQSINQVGSNVINGISNLGYQTLDLSSRNAMATQQGFNQIGRDMCTSSASIVSAVNGVGSQLAECCCATQRLIEREGCATRELIQALNTQNISAQLCDAKSKISSLEAQISNGAMLNNAVATIIKHIPTTTTSTAA